MRAILAPPWHYEWIAKRADLEVGPRFQAIEAVDENWTIHGMIGIDGWTKTSCVVHIALRNPLALRVLLPEAYRQACVVCDKRLVRAVVMGTNTKSLDLVARVGFREVFRGVDYFDDGVDLVAFEVTRAEWKTALEARGLM